MSPKVIITVIDGSLQDKQFEYTKKTECSIGREDSCTIVLSNDDSKYGGISRKHCLLDIDPPCVRIKQLSDTTTTKLNGIAIGKEFHTVIFSGNDGECLTLGKDKIQLRIGLTGNHPIDKGMDVTKDIIGGGMDATKNIVDILGKGVKKIGKHQAKLQPIVRPIGAFFEEFLELKKPNQDSVGKKDLETPESFHKYSVIKLIGTGGYGNVYLGSTTKGKEVAIKTMLSDVKSRSSQQEKFIREIDNIKSFNHRNIVSFIDHGAADGNYYYVMEYCKAGSLTRSIECLGGKLPLDLARSIIFQVLDGLEYLHTIEFKAKTEGDGFVNVRGIVHRDLKPSNILLKVEGLKLVAKISDFGLSKSFEIAGQSGITSLEQSGLGSYRFLPRRQLKYYRDSKPEVDIWAAAACLYYMLSGSSPRNFPDNISAETIVMDRPAIAIQQCNPDVPDSIAEVIDRALREDSQNDNSLFYQSVSIFRRDLLSAFEKIAAINSQSNPNDSSTVSNY
jgi:eukaryotic-like serine/threonine-protein kinase